MPDLATKIDDLPGPSPELVLMRVFVTSYLATAHMKPRQRAREFVRRASELLATEESAALVFPIRPAAQQAAAALARRQAVAMFRQYLPTFVAVLPPEVDTA